MLVFAEVMYFCLHEGALPSSDTELVRTPLPTLQCRASHLLGGGACPTFAREQGSQGAHFGFIPVHFRVIGYADAFPREASKILT